MEQKPATADTRGGMSVCCTVGYVAQCHKHMPVGCNFRDPRLTNISEPCCSKESDINP